MYTVDDAVSTKRYWDGTKFRILYQFKCEKCDADLWKRSGAVPKMVGLCRMCAAARPNVRVRKRPHEWRFNRIVAGAKVRDILVALTYENYLQFTSIEECHYCGSTIDWSPYKKGGKGQNHGGNLDRKDSSRGYEAGNCVVACPICNRIKNNHLSYEEMLRLSPVLREIMAGRQQEIR
jgi:hypothetical protein